MHIPENYLSPATCAVMTAAVLPVWVHAAKKIRIELPKEKIPMLGVGAAFSFLGMMFNVPLLGGTTGHAVGGTLIALLFGPNAACIAVSVALLLQALIFGDGGILAFGANCFNMAFVLPYAGYAVYKLLLKAMGVKKDDKLLKAPVTDKSVSGKELAAAAIGAYVGLNLAAFCAAVEFGIQPLLFKDSAGNSLYCPYDLSVAIPAMMLSHLAVAGFVEAAFTVAVYAFVRRTSPDLTYDAIRNETPAEDKQGLKKYLPVFILVAVLIIAVPLGLLAAGTAWGEWGADEIAEIIQNGKVLGYTPSGLANGWALEPIIPDYAIEGMNEVIAYILSAVLGTALLVIIFKLVSLPMKGKKVK